MGEIFFQTLNNGHRRASSPQSSMGPVPLPAANPARTGATTGTGCRGRPPKIRKEIAIQSAVIQSNRIKRDQSLLFVLEYRRTPYYTNECLEYQYG